MTFQDSNAHLPLKVIETIDEASSLTTLSHEWIDDETLVTEERLISSLPQKSYEISISRSIILSAPPPEDFTLTAYGFPEPAELRAEAAFDWTWLLAAGGAALLIGAWWMRRKAAAA